MFVCHSVFLFDLIDMESLPLQSHQLRELKYIL